MTDRTDRLEAIRRWLDGPWEYQCVADPDTLYENDETVRGGFMLMHASAVWTGIAVEIEGQRHYVAKTVNGGELRTTLRPSVPWRADGGVTILEGKLWFRYAARDFGRGWTTDSFQISEDEFHLSPGRFEHVRADGLVVSGTVRLRKMNDLRDFRWAPADVRSSVTVVKLPDTIENAERSALTTAVES